MSVRSVPVPDGRRLVSYDVWDTVLRRRCHPDAIKIHAARDLLSRLGADARPHLRDPWVVFHLRQGIEREIGSEATARGLDDEYSLPSVLSHLIERVTGGPAASGLIAALVRAEIEHEKRAVYPDPHIEAHLERDGAGRRIFISDFYMGKDCIRELLAHAGLDAWFDDGYVSCDAGLNKRSGRLFHHVIALERADARSMSHFGDNEHSDVRVPAQLGIQASLYLPEEEHRRRKDREQRFSQRTHASPASMVALREKDSDDLLAFVAHTAPLFIGFALFIQERVIESGVRECFFFTREGEFFLKLYRVLRAESPFRDCLPEGRLLEVSRAASFGPSLKSLEIGELMRLWNLYSIQSPRGFLRSLDLPEAQFASCLGRHGLPLDESVRYPWTDARMLALLADPQFTGPAGAILEQRRVLFRRYCAENNLHSESVSCATVDIGWRGTIQDNIATLFPDVRFEGIYLGLNATLNVQPPNTTKCAFGPDLNREPHAASRRLLDFITPIEMLTNSPSGSVAGYERRDDRVIATRVVDAGENAVFEAFTRRYQQLVLDLAAQLAPLLSADAISAAEMRGAALRAWNDIIRDPHLPLANAYFSLVHNELFGLGRFVSKSEGLSYMWPWRLLFQPSYRKKFRHHLSLLGWPEGYARLHGDRLLIPVYRRFFSKQ